MLVPISNLLILIILMPSVDRSLSVRATTKPYLQHQDSPECNTVPVNSEAHHKLLEKKEQDFELKTLNCSKESSITTESRPSVTSRENAGGLETGVWRCGQCFKSFTQRSLLQIHVCPQSPKRPYQCGHCTQSFSHPTDLRAHVVTHNSDRPFKCGFCARSFAGSTTLNNHIRTHTGQKPFVCKKCSRSFSQASQLSRHQRLPGDCSSPSRVGEN